MKFDGVFKKIHSNSVKCAAVLGILGAVLVTGPSHAIIADIDSTLGGNAAPPFLGAGVAPVNAVTVTLTPGDYEITPLAGTYTAWNSSGGGSNWLTFFNYMTTAVGGTTSDEINAKFSPGPTQVGQVDAATALAVGIANPTTFTIATAQDLHIWIPDFFAADNIGGISMDIVNTSASADELPEPPAMMLFGLLALYLTRRLGRA